MLIDYIGEVDFMTIDAFTISAAVVVMVMVVTIARLKRVTKGKNNQGEH